MITAALLLLGLALAFVSPLALVRFDSVLAGVLVFLPGAALLGWGTYRLIGRPGTR